MPNRLITTQLAAPLIWLLLSRVGFTQVQLDRFFPPAIAVGQESSVKAEGKFAKWPVEIECDRSDVTITADKDSGRLKVSVAQDGSPGVAWVRLHDASSASKLVPLLISPHAPEPEVEPNNSIEQATAVKSTSVVIGRLEKSGEVDTFRVDAKQGQTLVVSALAHRLFRSPMDAVLQLVDRRGNVIVQADDRRGLDPQIVYQVPRDGEIWIRIFAFPEKPNSTIGYAGAASFVYTMHVTTGPFVDHVLPLLIPTVESTANESTITRASGWNLPAKIKIQHSNASTISPRVAYVKGCLGWQWQVTDPRAMRSLFESTDGTPAVTSKFPFTFSGHISEPGEIDRVRFRMTKGTKYRATVHSRRHGFLLDSVLRLANSEDDAELGRNDDQVRNQFDAALEYTAKEDRDVELQISDLVDGFGDRHAYTVVVEESVPEVALTVDADHYALKGGESVEITVAVARLRGFKESLKIGIDGLPNGVSCEAVVSEPKGASAKSVKLKLTAEATATFQGTIRISARASDAKGQPMGDPITATYPLRDVVQLQDLWLTAIPQPKK